MTLSTSRATGYIVSLITIVCGLGFLVLHEVGVLQLDDRSVQSQCYDKPASAIRECLDNLLGERDKDPHDKPAGTAGAPDEATSLVNVRELPNLATLTRAAHELRSQRAYRIEGAV